jgi:hypothetical protein
MTPEERLRTLTEAASRGDFGGVDRVLEALADEGSPEAEATRAALESMRYFAQPSVGILWSLESLEQFSECSSAARVAAAIACRQHERAAVLAFDLGALDASLAMHRRLAPEDAWLVAGECWRALALGEELPAPTAELARVAHDRADAALAIEAAVLRSLAAHAGGDLDEAVASARHASRMSRTEAIPQAEYLANVVLARARRVTDRPHLATRILSALRRYATTPWQPWLCWELLLCGGFDSAPPRPDEDKRPAAHALRALRQLLDAAGHGERAAFDRAVEAARRTVDLRPFSAELEAVVSVTDPSSAATAGVAFVRGEDTTAPLGLAGLAAATSTSDIVAWVLARPGEGARRVLATGLALAEREGAVPLPRSAGKKARTDATLATLALAGEAGMGEEILFRAVYGFDYVSSRHQGVRRVLFHRARERLGDFGSLVREDGRVRLELRQPTLIPDPRTAPREEHEILAVLARWGHASPRRAAEELDVPVRTVQEALRRLAEDGVCRIERHGRRIDYHLDDSVFAEPTTDREIHLPGSD